MNTTQIETAGDTVTLRLQGEVTIEQARELHTALTAALPTGQTLAIDAAGVSRLDTAALQVLMAAAAAVPHAVLLAASSAWNDAFQRYGLENPYRLPTP